MKQAPNKKELVLHIDNNTFLRHLLLEDVNQDYVDWLNDYEVTKYTEQRFYKHSIESTRLFVKEKITSKNDFLFGIFNENQHIGNIKIGPIRWFHKTAEISYFLGSKKHWGKGIGSKAIKEIVNFGFEILNLEKITASYYEINIPSAKALEKNGFKVEGKKIDDVVFEGERINMVYVGNLKLNK